MAPKRLPYRLTVLLQLANDNVGGKEGRKENEKALTDGSDFPGRVALVDYLSLSINYLKYALVVTILLFNFILIETPFLFYVVQNVFVQQHFLQQEPMPSENLNNTISLVSGLAL